MTEKKMTMDELRKQRPSVAPQKGVKRVRTNGKKGTRLVPVTGKAAPAKKKAPPKKKTPPKRKPAGKKAPAKKAPAPTPPKPEDKGAE